MHETTGDSVQALRVAAVRQCLAACEISGVETAVRALSVDDLDALHPEERSAVDHASSRRQIEVASGRVLLRSMIGSTAPIRVGGPPDVGPDWVASISHDRLDVVAAVARSVEYRTVGIDLERTQALDDDEAAIICRPDDRVDDPLLAFVIKEAVYKAWSAGGGAMIEHHDVRVTTSADEFDARVIDAGSSFAGRWARVADVIVAVTAR